MGFSTASTVSTTAFASDPIYSGTTVPGSNLLTVIQSSNNSYVYPNTTAKHADRSDCAGTTCTYNEEMTNYANWWAYYRTRMQMMKTAASNSFSSIGTNFRVGFMTISNGYTNSKFRNLETFDDTTKNTWYTTLFSADPSSWTPLRGALSRAGRLYAGKLNGLSINGTSVTDPMQYSCQQNFTILSTDGYWNTPDESSTYGPFVVDADTNVGNTDGAEPRPYSDGAGYLQSTSQLLQTQTQISQSTSQLQKRTLQIQSKTSSLQMQVSQLQARTSNLQSQTSQLQTQTNQLQERTSTLQERTSQLQKRTYSQLQTRQGNGTAWGGWVNTTSCTWDTTGTSTMTSQRQCQYTGTTWSEWSNASTCDAQTIGTSTVNGTNWQPGVECQYTGWSGWSDVSSCDAVAQDTTDPYTGNSSTGGLARQCQYSAWSSWTNAASCSTQNQDTTDPYTIGTARECQWAGWSAWSGAPSCTAATQDTTNPYTGNSSIGGLARQCSASAVVTAPYANASSCTTTTIPDADGNTTQCRYTAWTGWSGVSACTQLNPSSGPDYSVSTATDCRTTITTPYSNASSCTSTTTPDVNGNTTQCQYTAWPASWSNASSCSSTDQSTESPYTVGTAIQCQTTDTGWIGASSCSAGSSGGQTVTSQPVTTGPTLVDTCTAATASSGNNYTQTICTPSTIASGVASCTPAAANLSNGHTSTTCATVTTGPTAVSSCTAASAASSNN